MAKRRPKPAAAMADAGEANDSTDRMMMKRRHDAPHAGGALGDFAEDLGTFLGNTERKASEWLNQRNQVTEQLTAVRDKAASLLSQMGSMVPEMPIRRRGRRAKRQTEPGRPKRGRAKGRTISEATRMKMAEAARRRWAARKRQT